MAKTGLKFPVFAPIVKEEYGKAPTYGAGFIIGEGISADLTLNYSDNPLYSNDRESNNDKTFTGGTIALGVDDYGAKKELAQEVESSLLGYGTDDVNTNVCYIGSNPNAPYGGTGYYKTAKYRDNGGAYYEAFWIYRTQYSKTSDSAKTKGSSVEWQTPELSGKIFSVPGLPADRDIMEKATFDTEEEARQWLLTKAKIPTETVSEGV